jgi:predicted DNA binding CopG/RHH family protein
LESNKRYTAAGTDIEEVKKKNAASGLSYNEVKRQLAEKHQSRKK